MASVSSLSSQSSIYSIVSSLMQFERAPVTRLQTQKGDLQTLSAIFSDVDTKLEALRNKAINLADTISSPFAAFAVSSSASDVVTATAGATAVAGTHDLHVYQLAHHHTLLSDAFGPDGTELITQAGEGTKTFNVTVNGVTTLVSVDLAAGADNEAVLGKIATAVNEALADVDDNITATALRVDGSNMRLSLRSNATGQTYKTALEDVSGGLLGILGLDNPSVAATSTTGGYVYADSQLNADFSVDGVRVQRDANKVDDVITGVTLVLRAAHTSATTDATLSVSRDAAAIRGHVQEFLSAYNDAINYLKAKTTVAAKTGARAALAGKFTYANLVARMRGMMAAAVPSLAGKSVSALAQIGIKTAQDGTLSLSDAQTFDDAVSAAPDAVAGLFNASDGLGTQLGEMLKPFVSVGGYIDIDKAAVASKSARLDDQITRLNARLNVRQQQLIKQYSQLQELMVKIQSQQSFFNNIMALYYGSSSG